MDIVSILAEAKFDVWYDSELSGGEVWWEQILLDIRKIEAFVFLVSEASIRSVPCLSELKHARSLERPIVPNRYSS